MDIESIEKFFRVKFQYVESSTIPDNVWSCHFEKGGMKYELMIIKDENRLYIKADPLDAFVATPAIEVLIQFDETEFEEIDNIGLGLKFKWKGKYKNFYLTRLENSFSISAS